MGSIGGSPLRTLESWPTELDPSNDPFGWVRGVRCLDGARYLIDVRGHHRLTIDPAAANQQAIRAYEKVGFRKVGILRRYQLFPDGTWQDGLLMEILADELRN